ncbi:hypothetical protein A2850_02050 [Candidatus Azambacteria bacterium RIFCSPHIGHO2_01_FULL_51_74]|nr:MAG: hypothetical protein A2850_02050 [Candidatus Azambacteria bacterium RIFCSPHIGHO2_01_FULL_51_74]
MESLIAIAVFTVGISTAMTVISTSLSVGTRTRDKIVASYLAQEGIEVVRSIRDNNWIDGDAWDAGIASGCVQWDSADVDTGCSAGSGLIFYPLATPPAYRAIAGTTKFSRSITVQSISADQIQVTSAVNCGLNCSVSLSEYLYNWK